MPPWMNCEEETLPSVPVASLHSASTGSAPWRRTYTACRGTGLLRTPPGTMADARLIGDREDRNWKILKEMSSYSSLTVN